MAGKYDQYFVNPPNTHFEAEEGEPDFDITYLKYTQLGYDMNMAFRFVTEPYVSNNRCHKHNFQEFLIWYGNNPAAPEELGGEILVHIGEEQEEHIITKPTVVNIPPELPHCPIIVRKVERPIIQIEIMLTGKGGTKDLLWEEDKLYNRVLNEFKSMQNKLTIG